MLLFMIQPKFNQWLQAGVMHQGLHGLINMSAIGQHLIQRGAG